MHPFPQPLVAGGGRLSAFNSADKAANVSLSNGNATMATSSAGSNGARVTTNHSVAPYHVEFKIVESGSSWGHEFGISTGAVSLTGNMQSPATVLLQTSGTGLTPIINGSIGSLVPMTGLNGATIAMDFDLSTNQMWFQASAPATDTTRRGPYSFTALGAAAFAFGFVTATTQSLTVTGDAGHFLLPFSGYAAWG